MSCIFKTHSHKSRSGFGQNLLADALRPREETSKQDGRICQHSGFGRHNEIDVRGQVYKAHGLHSSIKRDTPSSETSQYHKTAEKSILLLIFFIILHIILSMKNKLPKVIFIVGPTASGKTTLSIVLSKKFNGEIVNADSRQIYKEMDIATAKPIRDTGKQKKNQFVSQGVVHHLMDFVKPSESFTLADFKKQANLIIAEILSRGKLPIVVGGTGLYVWSLIDNLNIPKVKPNIKLRESFDLKTLDELVKLLKNIDSETAKKIDLKNRRRVLRALEVAISSGESFVSQTTKSKPLYDALQIGMKCDREKLYQNINNRVDQQVQSGLLEETKKLAKKYYWDLPSMSSIGYKQIGNYLRGEISLEAAIELFKRDTRHYAKRQETWFKRDKRIVWISPDDLVDIEKLIAKWNFVS